MKNIFVIFFVVLFASCQRDFVETNDKVLKQGVGNVRSDITISSQSCTYLEVPVEARKIHSNLVTPPNSWQGRYSPIVSVGYIIDYAAYTTLFYSNMDSVNRYMLNLNASVSAIQRHDSIIVVNPYYQVFTQPDSLNGNINNFTSYCTKQFGANPKADIYILLSYAYRGGGIAWVQGLGTSFNTGVCGINGSTGWNWKAATYPPLNYNWDIEVVTHEEGHIIGSFHTHDCEWNGNGTKIDGCGDAGGYIEGFCEPEPNLQHCPDAPYLAFDSINNQYVLHNPTCALPSLDSGTVMSYCDLINGVGINLHIGYGQQVSDTIRSYIYANRQYLISKR